MDEHDRPYKEYVSDGFHFSTTRVEFDFKRSAGFDDVIEVTTWLDWVRGVSLSMSYELKRGEDLLGVGSTEHALVNEKGRPARIPVEHRERLRGLSTNGEKRPRGRAGRSR
jgi:acyl-CoA thioesterase FadM